MLRRFVIVLSTLVFSFSVLFISILRTAAVRYSFSKVSADFSEESTRTEKGELDKMKIDYNLAYPGDVLPNHFLWPVKAARDKIWLLLTSNKSKKAELNLLFADKRLGAARILFEEKDYETGFTTLTKAEKYLETASNLETDLRAKGEDTNELLDRLAKASLKHRQVIKSIIIMAPDDAKPKIVEVENYSGKFFEEKSAILKAKNLPVPENPFNGD
jgi:hypothetical protein